MATENAEPAAQAVDWEACKENSMPVKSGRKAAALGEEDAQPASARGLRAAPAHAPAHEPAPPGRAFVLQCTVHAPVSWDGAHCFWVWSVESRG